MLPFVFGMKEDDVKIHNVTTSIELEKTLKDIDDTRILCTL